MPIYCRCNGSGSCKNCSCKKASRSCSDCLPRRRGRCTNSDQQLSRPSTDSTPVPGQTLPPSFTNEPPSCPPAETAEALQHAETRVRLTPDLAAIDVTPITPVMAIMPSQILPPSPINEPPSSAPPAKIVETPQHTETRVSLTPDPAAIDVTPPTSVTAIMPSKTLLPSAIKEPPSSAPPAEIVETPQHTETRVIVTPDPVAIDVTPSTSVTALDDLPSYAPVPNPCYRWGDKDGKTFAESINLCYKETVHWRRKPF